MPKMDIRYVAWLVMVVLMATCLKAHTFESQEPTPPAEPDNVRNPIALDSTTPDSVQLEPIKMERAAFPVEAAKGGIQGQVLLKLFVSEDGSVNDVQVISGNPLLAKAAVDAAKKWKFKPFIRDGKAISVSTKLPFDFVFKDNVNDTPEVVGGSVSRPQDVKDALTAKRVRASQQVMQGLLIHKVQPVYPIDARLKHIQGAVVLSAVIGTDGRIHHLKAISGPKQLVESAVGAVQQWRYKPYLLEGNPVSVETQITVNYQLSR